MRAILITTWELRDISISEESISSSLMLLIDRPFIQHVIEYLVNQGIMEFDVVLCQSPEKIKELLGDGKRWGVKIRYHLVKDPAKPYDILRRVTSDPEHGSFLLVHTDRLPIADVSSFIQNNADLVLYFWNVSEDKHKAEEKYKTEETKNHEWAGWAIIPDDCAKGLPKNSDEENLLNYLLSFPNFRKNTINDPARLNVRSHKDLLLSHGAVIDKKFENLMITGNEVEDGVWISKNVSLHPSVKITPPIYIGENCNIEKDVCLGPHVVVGKNSIISSQSVLKNAVISPRSYIGKSLELCDVLVNQNRLVNVRLGTEITITEDIILGSMAKKIPVVLWWKKLFSRTIAFNLILLTLPLFLIISLCLKIFRNGNVFYTKKAVQLPADPDMALWRTFSLFSYSNPDMAQKTGLRDLFFRFLPGLINIAKGNLHFVGVQPRTPEEINALPQEWRSLYLNSKPGVITEALVNFGEKPDEDELFSAEAFYSVSTGLRYDFRILVKYLGQITGFVPLPENKSQI